MDRCVLGNILLILIIGIAIILLCYHYVDRNVVDFVYYHHWQYFSLLKWLTYIPPMMAAFAFLSLIYITLKKWLSHIISVSEYTVLVASVNTLIAHEFAETIKSMFGRTWPATWIYNNPSWLKDHVYGFNFFHGGVGYASFPSGHSVITFSMITVLWIAVPRWRWLFALIAFAVCIGLIGMSYHFVSDIAGGALLGILTGIAVTNAFLKNSQSTALRKPMLSKAMQTLHNNIPKAF